MIYCMMSTYYGRLTITITTLVLTTIILRYNYKKLTKSTRPLNKPGRTGSHMTNNNFKP